MRKNIIVIRLFVLFSFFWVINPVYADKVAIIGGGAAGMTTAFLTEEAHDVTLYEAGESLGGHAKTEVIEVSGKKVAIDAGAEFFNRAAYPNFIKLLEYLLVTTATFALGIRFYHQNRDQQLAMPPVRQKKFDWNTLRPSNLWRLIQLKWVLYRGSQILANKQYDITLKDFVDGLWVGNSFKEQFLYPLLTAGWGITIDQVKNISAYEAVKYLIAGESSGNEWLEIPNGFSSYIKALEAQLTKTTIERNSTIASVTKEGEQYCITKQNGESALFDQVVFAVNPKICSQLIKSLPKKEELSKIFSKVQTYDTTIVLCKAEGNNLRFIPDNPEVANIRYNGENSALTVCKSWKTDDQTPPILKIWLTHDVRASGDTLGALPENPIATHHFEHIYMDLNYYRAYQAAQKEQGKDGLWFPGLQEDDSHETALTAAIDVAKQLAPNSKRLAAVF